VSYPLRVHRAELALNLPNKIAVSTFGEINASSQQLCGFVKREVGGFWLKSDRDDFRHATRIENTDCVRPSKTVVRTLDAYNRAAKLLDVTDCALVLLGQFT
jgi:hypothetical protein